jgi:excisionase family DNA binding protein
MKRIIFDGFPSEEFWEILTQKIEETIQKVLRSNQYQSKDQYLTREECCRLLRISLPTFHRWCKSGKLKVHKAGGRILVRQAEIDAVLHEVTNLKYRSPP